MQEAWVVYVISINEFQFFVTKWPEINSKVAQNKTALTSFPEVPGSNLCRGNDIPKTFHVFSLSSWQTGNAHHDDLLSNKR